MKQNTCYDRKKLLELLPDYDIVQILTIDESEDEVSEGFKSYIVKKSLEIEKIKSHHSFWTSVSVFLKNGESITLRSNNVNVDDGEMLRINNNNYISPSISIEEEYILSREPLKEWLTGQGITAEQLDTISKSFDVYEIIEYPGVPTPNYYPSVEPFNLPAHWGYSSENLKLDEREINKVLDGIEDIVLREKIKCILYARVFKRQY